MEQVISVTATRKFKFNDILITWSPLDVNLPSTVYSDYAAGMEHEILQSGKFVGLCNLSGTPTEFSIAHHNLRETVVATSSNSYNRQRQLVCAISIGLFGHPYATIDEIAAHINFYNLKLFTAEANAALFLYLKRLLRPELFYYSEYFGPDYQSGQMVNGVRHEDLQQTSFPDETFDIVLTAEVFEHIPDAIKAEREIIRILKKGGIYCFTVPFAPYAEHDNIRASLDSDGNIVHHAPPEYHGDPVRPEEGVLVYRVFSQRDMEQRFTALDCEFVTYHLWSRMLGILGANAMVHVASKLPKRSFASAPAPALYPDASLGNVEAPVDSPNALVEKYGEKWVASYLSALVEYFVSNQKLHDHFEYWQERGFHITLNHYYEPIPDTRTLSESLWKRNSELPGVDMNDVEQLRLLREVFPTYADEYNAIPHDPPSEPHLFYFNNPMFSGTDALALYCMIRHYKPQLVLETGSGMSTRISAQAALLNGNTKVIAIEPYPNEFLQKGFPGLSSLIVKPIEAVDLSVFQKLQAGDIFFIDTTHVVKIGGDVNYLFLEVLPRLNKGVIVHIHDIFLPHEYRQDWVMDLHRFWTEQYLLQAFLILNNEFEVIFGNTYLANKYPAAMKKTFPNSPWWGGGSFWIRRKL